MITPLLPFVLGGQVAQDHDVTHARAMGQRLIDDGLGAYRLAATQGAIHGDHSQGATIVQALGDGVGAKAREHRQHDGTDLGHGQHRCGCVWQVRKIHANHIAATQAQAAQAPG